MANDKSKDLASNVLAKVEMAKEAITGWRLLLVAIYATTIIYFVQIFFAVACLAGYLTLGGLDSSAFLSAADVALLGGAESTGAWLFWLGAAGAGICGFATFLVSAAIFAQKGLDTMVGFSIIIPPIIIGLLLCPVLNFFPLMWLWCLYAAFKGVRP